MDSILLKYEREHILHQVRSSSPPDRNEGLQLVTPLGCTLLQARPGAQKGTENCLTEECPWPSVVPCGPLRTRAVSAIRDKRMPEDDAKERGDRNGEEDAAKPWKASSRLLPRVTLQLSPLTGKLNSSLCSLQARACRRKKN